MQIDAVRGLKLGCLGTLCFLVPPLLLGAFVAGTMGFSTKDSSGSLALGVGILLFFVGNGAWAAFLALGVLAATGPAPTRTDAVGAGSAAGALFTLAIVTVPATRHFWLLPLTSGLFVLAIWSAWQRMKPRK